MTLVIDCSGHYTTAPEPHDAWREAQKAAFKAGQPVDDYPAISDDQIRERRANITIFSPRASAMAHYVRDQEVSEARAYNCNNLIARVCDRCPGHYFDDTKRYIDALPITPEQRHAFFEGNARKVFLRLNAKLKARGL